MWRGGDGGGRSDQDGTAASEQATRLMDLSLFIFFSFAVPEIEPRVSDLQGKCSEAELHVQTHPVEKVQSHFPYSHLWLVQRATACHSKAVGRGYLYAECS